MENMKTREFKYDLLRLTAMFFVIVAHFFSSSNWIMNVAPNQAGPLNAAICSTMVMLGQVGVSLFLIISGYFLYSNKNPSPFGRIAKLELETLSYSIPLLFLFIALLGLKAINESWRELLSIEVVLKSAFPITRYTYWFISSYCAVILFSPYLIFIIKMMNIKQTRFFMTHVILVFFLWKLINPFSQYSTDFTYAMILFLTGCCIRKRKQECSSVNPTKHLLISLVYILICFLATSLLYSYQDALARWGYWPYMLICGTGSIPLFSLLCARELFLAVDAWNTDNSPRQLQKIVLGLSPGVLGVYLIHTHPLISPILWAHVFATPEPIGAINKIGFSLIACVLIYASMLIGSNLWVRFISERLKKQLSGPLSQIDKLAASLFPSN